jgi:hypothetical protein
VKIPQVLFPGVAEAFQAADMDFTETQYSCALRRDDLTPHVMSNAHVHKDSESGNWPFGWWRTSSSGSSSPDTNTTPKPSSSSYVNIAAALVTGIVAFN